MALTYEAVKKEADALKAIADEVAAMHARINQIVEHNADLAIDWTAGSTPAYITEDPDGNMTGYTFTRQQIGNLIGTLSQLRTLLTNGTPTTGDHLGNVNLVAAPL